MTCLTCSHFRRGEAPFPRHSLWVHRASIHASKQRKSPSPVGENNSLHSFAALCALSPLLRGVNYHRHANCIGITSARERSLVQPPLWTPLDF